MKRLVLASSLAVVTALTVSAQTNTFPASGNVGIGTTSPQQKLAVDGYIEAQGLLPSSSFLIRTNPNDTQTFQTQGSLGKWVFTNNDGGGFFGIGTSSPSVRLTVQDTSHQLYLKYSSADTLRIFRDEDKGVIQAQTDGIGYDSLVLNPLGGNVGIGTPNPSAKLAVHAGTLAGLSGSALEISNQAAFAPNHVQLVTRLLRSSTHNGWESAALQLVRRTDVTDQASISLVGDNVGVGTINAAIKLTVAGGGGYTGVQIGTEAGGAFLRWSREGRGSDANKLHIFDQDGGATIATFQSGGNVGIGTTNPAHKLAVNGTIKAKEVIVETTGWSDYVFADDYRLAPLAEVEAHIKTNKHLPGIPSANEVAAQGVSLGDMQAKLLAKIEELTLHQIAQQKLLAAQSDELAALRAEIRALRR